MFCTGPSQVQMYPAHVKEAAHAQAASCAALRCVAGGFEGTGTIGLSTAMLYVADRRL